jgi:ABC-type sugar transport system permease subunit
VSPWLIGLTLFYIVLLGVSLVMSFTNYELVDQDDTATTFIGFDNWRRLISDPDVTQGAWVTFKFALIFIPMSVFLPLLFAFLLTAKHLWGRSFFRLMFYLPTMVPLIAAVMVWRFYLNGQTGWIARALGVIGIESPDFLTSKPWVLPSLALIATWGIGNAIIIFIAALNGVPKQLYEAATIDGAGPWRLFRDVTWPMISPITFYNVVISFVALGQYFIVPFVLLGPEGQPDGAGRFYTMTFFKQSFKFFQAGYGAALAWAMFAVVLSITAMLFWSSRYWVHYEYEER